MARITREDLERARGKFSPSFLALNPHLAGKTAPATAPAAPCGAPKPEKAPPAPRGPAAAKFEEVWQSLNGPPLEKEWRFHQRRNWRTDYAHPATHIAIELEGGIYNKNGHHNSPKGYTADCVKYNAAAGLGWRVFRLATGMFTHEHIGPVVDAIRQAQTAAAKESAK